MVITFQGDNYFKIQSGEFTLLIDPTNQRSFKGAGIVLSTLQPALIEASLDDQSTFFITHQGEYEVQGVRIRGWSMPSLDSHEKTVYRFEFDDIVLVTLGYLDHELEPEIQEHISNPDILFIPGKGAPLISHAYAAKLARQLEPSLIIPSLFSSSKPLAQELDCDIVSQEKVVTKKKELHPKAMSVIFLTS